MPQFETFHFTSNMRGSRLDQFVEAQYLVTPPPTQQLSRTYIQQLIRDGAVTVNGKTSKPGYKLRKGDQITLRLPNPSPLEAIPPESIALDILYEDASVIVIDKPAGMLVHPAGGVYTGTLVNALLGHCKDLSGIGGTERPGIVHRLDKDTSGVLVAAKTDRAHRMLSAQFEAHSTTRGYLAAVCGIPKPGAGMIDEQIARSHRDRRKMAVVKTNGRRAVTHYRVLEVYEGFSLLQLTLETGRLHQIRVHLSFFGYPVAGDAVYGGGRERALSDAPSVSVRQALIKLNRQALHAETLGFTHPETNERLEFSAPMPSDMQQIVDALRNRNQVIANAKMSL